MFGQFDIDAAARKLDELGVPEAEFCRRADINVTTWGRWKRKEFSPSFRSAQRAIATLNDLTNQHEKGAVQ